MANHSFPVSLSPILPPPLTTGAHLRVIAPAGSVNKGMLERGIERLRLWGYRVTMGESVLKCSEYLAGTDEERFSDLWEALTDPEVEAVICARGGYGTMRLLSRIDWNTPLLPKWFVGFSDLGALQINLAKRWGWVSLSGPQVASGLGAEVPDPWTLQQLKNWWEGNIPSGKLTNPQGELIVLQSHKRIETKGELIPICLSVLTALIGTPYIPNLHGSLLVFEDIGEPLYRIDRMLWQIGSSGVLEGVKGIILGYFLYKEQDFGEKVAQLIEHYFPHLPVWWGLPYSHREQRLILPFGLTAGVTEEGEFLLV
ncbi:MAG: LD-carboxypeptidase [bacterium]